MKKTLGIILLLAIWQGGCQTSTPTSDSAQATPQVIVSQPEVLEPLQALQEYKEAVARRGDLRDQGVLIETFDEKTLAQINADYTFNPASVMKLSTSLVALTKLSPDYRYRTNLLADGRIDALARKLEGDLVVEGGTDPMFSANDAQEVASQLSSLGISRVTGALRITGSFYFYARGYHLNLSHETSANKLRTALERAGIKIDGETVFGEKSGTLLLSHYSDQLVNILLYQNAYSSNAVAEVVGESVGGPQAIQDFLIDQLKLKDSEVYVSHASGLDFNRITPRASLKVLRSLIAVLDKYSLQPQDIMAVAGVDSGTLRVRLAADEIRGSVIAKTGTLVSTDDGVSTLVGIVYTKTHGPLLFAIFNSEGSVNSYRKLQDQFIKKLIEEEGGPAPVSRSEDALAEQSSGAVTQVLYKNPSQPAQTNGGTD